MLLIFNLFGCEIVENDTKKEEIREIETNVVLIEEPQEVREKGEAIVEKAKKIVEDKPYEPIEIIFVGDVMFEWSLKETLKRKGVDYPFEQIKERIKEVDFAVVNLETAITIGTEAYPKKYNFKSEPETLNGLLNAGFDLVSLANNHTMDFGEKGLIDTMKNLEEYNLPYIGSGLNKEEAYMGHEVVIQGKKIKFLAFSRVLPTVEWYATDNKPGIASGYQEDYVTSVIEKEKQEEGTDIVFVYIHWGVERNKYPEDYQRKYARKMIEAGADAVVGAHPHVLQGFEFYNGKPIAYSLGNFLFPNYVSGHSAETGLLSLIIEENNQIRMEFEPFYIHNDQIVDKGIEYQNKILNYLEGISYDVIIENKEVKSSKMN